MDPSYNNTFDSFGSGGGQMTQPIMSTGSGDIVLSSNQPAKKKKMGIIVGIVLILVAIGVGVAALIMFLNKGSVQKDFKEIVTLVEAVPSDFKWPDEEEDYSEEKEWVYAILISYNNAGSISSYYDELDKKYENFLAKYQNSLSNDLLSEYSNMLKILRNAIDYRKRENDLIKAYDVGGAEGANEFYKNNIECDPKDDYLRMVCDIETEYYDALIAEYAGDVDYDTSIQSELPAIRNRLQDGFVMGHLSRNVRKINEEILGGLNE